MDERAFLQRVAGDEVLAAQLAEVLLESLPGLQAELTSAVAGGQGTPIARAAHTIKGAVATFSAHGAEQHARTLEGLGRRDARPDPGDVARAHRALQDALDALRAQVTARFSRRGS